MRTGPLTLETIAARKLGVNLHGLTDQLKAGAVLHMVHDGATFILATNVDAARARAIELDTAEPMFVIDVYDALIDRVTGGAEEPAVLRSLDGTPLTSITVRHERHQQMSRRGQSLVAPVLAEDVTAGDVIYDGAYTGGKGPMAGRPIVFTVTADTAAQYLPGRVVLRVVNAASTPIKRPVAW